MSSQPAWQPAAQPAAQPSPSPSSEPPSPQPGAAAGMLVGPVVDFDPALVWDRRTRLGRDGQSECKFKRAAYSPEVKLCLRPYMDLVSASVQANGDWAECADLSRIWHSGAMKAGSSADDMFFDIGANIGVCTMHMAFRSRAKAVVAFEPSEKNLFYLTGTFLNNPSYLSRVQ
eukprot:8953569-Heterocapsa_arctica.AAC.1